MTWEGVLAIVLAMSMLIFILYWKLRGIPKPGDNDLRFRGPNMPPPIMKGTTVLYWYNQRSLYPGRSAAAIVTFVADNGMLNLQVFHDDKIGMSHVSMVPPGAPTKEGGHYWTPLEAQLGDWVSQMMKNQ